MQMLRTICLKCCRRRKLLLHDPAADDTQRPAPMRDPFPFVHKPDTLDRDRIVVPAGWDNWGNITVLRDGFDAKAWGEAW